MDKKFSDRVFRVLFVFAFVLGFAGIPGQSAEAQVAAHIIEVNIDDYYVTAGTIWPAGALLTLTISASGLTYSAQTTAQEDGGWFDLPQTLNLQTGDVITITDGTNENPHCFAAAGDKY